MYVWVYVFTPATVGMYRSEDKFRVLILFFRHVGPKDATQVIGLSNGHLYPLGHLSLVLSLYFKDAR